MISSDGIKVEPRRRAQGGDWGNNSGTDSESDSNWGVSAYIGVGMDFSKFMMSVRTRALRRGQMSIDSYISPSFGSLVK